VDEVQRRRFDRVNYFRRRARKIDEQQQIEGSRSRVKMRYLLRRVVFKQAEIVFGQIINAAIRPAIDDADIHAHQFGIDANYIAFINFNWTGIRRRGVPAGVAVCSGPINSGRWRGVGAVTEGEIVSVRLSAGVTTRDDALAEFATVMLPACEYRRTELPPPPTRLCNCGLAPRLTASESIDDETLPVFESATTLARALFGSSTRISPEPLCVRSAAGKPCTTTDPSDVTIARCARAGIFN